MQTSARLSHHHEGTWVKLVENRATHGALPTPCASHYITLHVGALAESVQHVWHRSRSSLPAPSCLTPSLAALAAQVEKFPPGSELPGWMLLHELDAPSAPLLKRLEETWAEVQEAQTPHAVHSHTVLTPCIFHAPPTADLAHHVGAAQVEEACAYRVAYPEGVVVRDSPWGKRLGQKKEGEVLHRAAHGTHHCHTVHLPRGALC